MERAEVAVVGAGPAGLAAAALLAEHGVEVVLIDERPRPGGQIYRQPPEGFGGADLPRGRGYGAAAGLIAAADAPGVRLRPGTLAWGLFEPQDAGPLADGEKAAWVRGARRRQGRRAPRGAARARSPPAPTTSRSPSRAGRCRGS